RFIPTPPACRRCATICAARQLLGLVAALATMVSTGVLARQLGWGGPARLALSAAAPLAVPLLWRWAVPSWFAVGYGLAPGSLAYTFRRRDAALDFARRNALPDDDADGS